jgi:thiosulfate reductase cytochrome b subunit
MPTSPSNAPKSNEPKVKLYKKHSFLTRGLHWLNMVAIGALIATGIAMMVGGDSLKSIGESVHEVFYFLLFGIAAVYAISQIAGGAWKIFLPTRETLEDASAVVKSELGMGSHTPRLQKYNGAQRLAYGAVFLMVAGEIVTGLAMAYHDQVPWLAALFGGRHTAHAIHKLLMFGIVAFVIVHVAQVIRAGWPSLRSMISGYDVVPAGGTSPSDGAIPEPGKLGVLVPQSAAQKTLDAQTRWGFIGAAAAAAAGAVLLAIGSAREAGAEGAEGGAARPSRRRRGVGGADLESSETSSAPAGDGGNQTAQSSAETQGSAGARRARQRKAGQSGEGGAAGGENGEGGDGDSDD